MKITVEFSGGTRAMTGVREAALDMENGCTYRNVVQRLAGLFPELLGAVIADDRNSLLSAMIFNRNGEECILPDQMDLHPQESDRLLLMFFIVGG
jgi:hypothetical protein